MWLRVVGVQRDGLLEPAHAEVVPSKLEERLPREKEIAWVVRVTLSRFDCQVEGMLQVSSLISSSAKFA